MRRFGAPGYPHPRAHPQPLSIEGSNKRGIPWRYVTLEARRAWRRGDGCVLHTQAIERRCDGALGTSQGSIASQRRPRSCKSKVLGPGFLHFAFRSDYSKI